MQGNSGYETGMNARDNRILVADDDPDLRGLVVRVLERAGFPVTAVGDGAAAVEAFFADTPALALLDIAMPRMDGWTALGRMREASDVPIIMLTARTSETEKVRALRAGADDYLTKPFGTQELVARIEAVLRRSPDTNAAVLLEDRRLTVDVPAREAAVEGTPVPLTPLEFRLLVTLMQHRDEVLSTDRLCELVWDDPTGLGRDQVKLYVGYLRRKLAAAGPADWHPIENVRGHGYRYVYVD
jgi:DNA-binding response OmpR family regulator